MHDVLQLHDPLAEKRVTIMIRLQPDQPQRDARTALVTVGVEGEVPVLQSGRYDEVGGLIDEAWRQYGLRVAPSPAPSPSPATAETAGTSTSTTLVEVAVEPSSETDTVPTPAKQSILDLF